MRVLCVEVGSAWKGEEASTLDISKFPENAEATQEHMVAAMMKAAEGEGIVMSSWRLN
jgi:hypothetical protein